MDTKSRRGIRGRLFLGTNPGQILMEHRYGRIPFQDIRYCRTIFIEMSVEVGK